MRAMILAALAASAMAPVAATAQDYNRGYDRSYDNRDNRGYDNRGYDNRSYANRGYDNSDYRGYNRDDGNYYPERDYRADRRYRVRQLSANDQIYRGHDGRYYCRRNDGTTGLIVGGAGGALLGSAIAPGGSGLLGAVLGGAGGALLGKSIDQRNSNVRCR